MKSTLTKLIAGAAAIALGGALVATAAHAQTPATDEPLANYQVVPASDSDLCGFQITDNKRQTLYVVYGAKDHVTVLVYQEQDVPDLTGKTFPVTLVLDGKQYDMNATGVNGGLMIMSNDDSVPANLIAADTIEVKVGDAQVFAIASDKQFDDAMDKTVVCSQTHK